MIYSRRRRASIAVAVVGKVKLAERAEPRIGVRGDCAFEVREVHGLPLPQRGRVAAVGEPRRSEGEQA